MNIRGTRWMRCDLHIHDPKTALANNYSHEEKPYQKLAEIIGTSDLEIIGITDYFSVGDIENIRNLVRGYDRHKKILVNVELRLSEDAGNGFINYHLIFDPDVELDKIRHFCSSLVVDGSDGKTVGEFNRNQFGEITVNYEQVESKLRAHIGEDYRSKIIELVPARNDGVRHVGQGKSPTGRQKSIARKYGRKCDALFGNQRDLEWSRLDDVGDSSAHDILGRVKPVFSCSDAHSVEQLEKFMKDEPATWIRGATAFGGLKESLTEPIHRCVISSVKPGQTSEFYTIDHISFDAPGLFQEKIKFNPGLNAIIGPRSSGKSTLLSQLARAIDQEGTLEAQKIAQPLKNEKQLGPADGISWANSQERVRSASVVWGSLSNGYTEQKHSVTYIPQNYLNQVSSDEAALSKLLERRVSYSEVLREDWNSLCNCDRGINKVLRETVEDVLEQADLRRQKYHEMTELGDPTALREEIERVEREYSKLNQSINSPAAIERREILETADEIQAAQDKLELTLETALQRELSSQTLLDLMFSDLGSGTEKFLFPDERRKLSDLAEGVSDLRLAISERWKSYGIDLIGNLSRRASELDPKDTPESDPVRSSSSDGELARVRTKLKELLDRSGRVDVLKEEIETKDALLSDSIDYILAYLVDPTEEITSGLEKFNSEDECFSQDGSRIFAECAIDYAVADEVATRFIERGQHYSMVELRRELSSGEVTVGTLGDILHAMISGKLTVRSAYKGSPRSTLSDLICSFKPIVRVGCEYDGDRIGGHWQSSMSAGKRAMIALSILLNTDASPWPLLLDQPEDDLDSRSVYESIAPYLRSASLRRQIIMVTHNANLVVGADSDLVTVANRHSEDGPNLDDVLFSYEQGTLEGECYKVSVNSPIFLRRVSMKDHICNIVDGGRDAFAKRERRYGGR